MNGQVTRWTDRQTGKQADRLDGLTPTDADEHPLPEFVGGVGEDDGRVEITAFTEHPEEVRYMEVIITCRHQPAPHLEELGGGGV